MTDAAAPPAEAPPVAQRVAPRVVPRPRLPRHTLVLPIASLLIPLLMLLGGGWLMWRNTWLQAEREVAQTAEAMAEYTERALEGYRLALRRVNDLLEGLSDAQIHIQEYELHAALEQLIAESPRATGAFVLDRLGTPLLSGAIFPVPRAEQVGRDDAVALAADAAPPLAIGRLYPRRADGRIVFVLSERRRRTANGRPEAAFDGTVSVSIDTNELAVGLARLRGLDADGVNLAREDGEILSRTGGISRPLPRIRADAPFHGFARAQQRQAQFMANSAVTGDSVLVGMRRLEGFPLYATVWRPRSVIVGQWRANMATRLVFGLPATFALLWLSLRVRRDQVKLAAANSGLAQALGEREARLRRVQRIGRVGGFEIDLRTGIRHRSAEYMAVHGWPAEARDETWTEWMARIHPEDRARVAGMARAASVPGAPRRDGPIEYRVLAPDGAMRWVASRSEVERAPDGTVLRLVGANVDITAQKAAEAALASSEARFRATFEQAAVGIAHVGLDGSWLEVNDRLCELLGHGRAALLGLTFQQLTHPADLDADLARMRALLAGEVNTYSMEKRYLRADGGVLWATLTVALVGDAVGVPAYFIAVIEDISERKAAEAALRASEAQLQALVATLDLSTVLVTDPDGVVRYWSDGCQQLFGWTAEQAAGRPVAELIGPRDRRQQEAVTAALLQGGAWSGDLTKYRRDGTTLTVAARIVLRRDAAGRPVALMQSLSDVTALRRAQTELEALNAALEQRVAEAVAAREAALTRAAHAERMQVLGQLAGGVAHDLNNILQMVRSSAELAMLADTGPARVQVLAGTIVAAAERGAAVTSRLLGFARRVELQAVPLDLGLLLGQLDEVLAFTLGPDIHCRRALPEDLPPLLADRRQLETVLLNLASNARDAMPFGGTLRFTAAAEVVPAGADHPAGLRPGRYIRLAVADDGHGMDAATLAHATEPFFTTKPVDRGTGLGLSAAKGFAEQSGGALRLESPAVGGTVVTLWLPQAGSPAAPAAAASAAPPELTIGATVRVLLVDDDPLVRQSLAAQIETADCLVEAVPRAADALALLRDGLRPDVLVTDFAMPGMTGLELIAAARQLCPGLPAVLLTGFVRDEAALAAAGSEASFALLRKPVSLAALSDAMARAITGRLPVPV